MSVAARARSAERVVEKTRIWGGGVERLKV
jgi:hypothetical protein